MKTHRLSIIASGLDVTTNDYADRFFEAGCDDATVSLQKGRFVLDFDRAADSFEKALISAIHDVKRSGATRKLRPVWSLTKGCAKWNCSSFAEGG